MQGSLEHVLEQVARRGSWVGGGSVAALGAALAAALLEKLVIQPHATRTLRRLRRECVLLIDRDAERFARVIAATRAGNHEAFRRALKLATEGPCRVYQDAQQIEAMCRIARHAVKPQFQSDLRCAMAMAAAARVSSHALIETNLVWLKDRAYATTIRRRLRRARDVP